MSPVGEVSRSFGDGKASGGLGDYRNTRSEKSASEFMAIAARRICKGCPNALIMSGKQQAKRNRAYPVSFCLL